MKNPECLKIYDEAISGESADNQILFKLAQCFLDGFEPKKLSEMLMSSDEGIVSDGLFVVSEIGSLASNYADELRSIALGKDPDFKKQAAHLLEVYSV